MILLDAIFILILLITVYKTDETVPIIDTLLLLAQRYLYGLCACMVAVGAIVVFRGVTYFEEIDSILLIPIYYLVLIGCAIPIFYLYKKYVAKNKLYYLGSKMLSSFFWAGLIAVHLLTALTNIMFTN